MERVPRGDYIQFETGQFTPVGRGRNHDRTPTPAFPGSGKSLVAQGPFMVQEASRESLGTGKMDSCSKANFPDYASLFLLATVLGCFIYGDSDGLAVSRHIPDAILTTPASPS